MSTHKVTVVRQQRLLGAGVAVARIPGLEAIWAAVQAVPEPERPR